MNLELVYNFLNLVVLPFWLLMIFAPRWTVTKKVIGSLWPFAIVPLIYVFSIALAASEFQAVPLDFSLAGITALAGSQQATLILWAHILALDLFAARWVFHDSQERGMVQWLASLFVFSIMMAGPAGLLLYILARSMKKRPENA